MTYEQEREAGGHEATQAAMLATGLSIDAAQRMAADLELKNEDPTRRYCVKPAP